MDGGLLQDVVVHSTRGVGEARVDDTPRTRVAISETSGCHPECGGVDGSPASAPSTNPVLSRWAKYSGWWTPSGCCRPRDSGSRRSSGCHPECGGSTAAMHPRRRRIQCCPDGPNIVGGGLLQDVIAHRITNSEKLGLVIARQQMTPTIRADESNVIQMAKHNGQWTPHGWYTIAGYLGLMIPRVRRLDCNSASTPPTIPCWPYG